MSLGKLAILCMLRVANPAREDGGEYEFLQTELGHVSCDEDKLPSEVDNDYCASYEGNLTACLGNGCRAMEESAKSGRLSCKAKCKDDSAPEKPVGLRVPEKVKSAVQNAQVSARAKESSADEKVKKKKEAEMEAEQKKTRAIQVAEAATESLRQAEAKATETQQAEKEMKTAVAEAEQKDSEFMNASSDYKAAQSVKQQKLAVMKQTLTAKQTQETEWHMQAMTFNQEMVGKKNLLEKLKKRKLKAQQLLKKLEPQIAWAEARVIETGKKRNEIKKLEDKKFAKLKANYTESFNAYVAEKERVQNLGDDANSAEARNKDASSSAKAKVREYWRKTVAARTAFDEKAEAWKQSDAAQAAVRKAEFFVTAQSQEMASALKEQAEAKALKDKVEDVDKYATEFYKKLQEVNEPEGNDMQRVMTLVSDPAMKPCLNSYNIIIRAANKLAESNAEDILADLKEGLAQINEDRASHFKSWCKTEDVAHWIWGANEIEKEELNY